MLILQQWVQTIPTQMSQVHSQPKPITHPTSTTPPSIKNREELADVNADK